MIYSIDGVVDMTLKVDCPPDFGSSSRFSFLENLVNDRAQTAKSLAREV